MLSSRQSSAGADGDGLKELLSVAVCFKGEVVEQHISGDMQQISASQFLRDASGGGGGGSLLRLLRERLAMEKRGVQKLEQRASRQKKPVTFLVSEIPTGGASCGSSP